MSSRGPRIHFELPHLRAVPTKPDLDPDILNASARAFQQDYQSATMKLKQAAETDADEVTLTKAEYRAMIMGIRLARQIAQDGLNGRP